MDITSSPYWPRGNGKAESAGFQRCLGLNKDVSKLVQSEISLKREKAKKFYDRKAGKEHLNVPIESYVYSKPCPRNRSSPWQYGQVVRKPTSRSYVISTSNGTVRRNRAQIRQASLPSPQVKMNDDIKLKMQIPEDPGNLQLSDSQSTAPEVQGQSQVLTPSSKEFNSSGDDSNEGSSLVYKIKLKNN
ncbi:Hypothetical predicted protein, partial [Paramuricea clavata]